jgi:hypothetical protein
VSIMDTFHAEKARVCIVSKFVVDMTSDVPKSIILRWLENISETVFIAIIDS